MAKNNKKSAVKKIKFIVELSLAETFGWAALLVFICGWFFILGIFVGRGLVPVPDGDGSVKKYFAEAKDQAPATVPPAPVDEKPAASEPEQHQARQTSPPDADTPEKVPMHEKPVNMGAGVKDAAGKPDSDSNKIFTIQVAALREQDAADKLFEKLKKEKYAPYMVKADLPDNETWYRLRCGQFESHDEAAPILERLRKNGYSPILVRR